MPELVCSTTKRKFYSRSTNWPRSPYARDTFFG